MPAPLSKDDLVHAIQNLNALTRDRDLAWRSCAAPVELASIFGEAKAAYPVVPGSPTYSGCPVSEA